MKTKRIILSRAFFDRPTPRVARELLGKYLVRRMRGKERAYMIAEVEVYDGPRDRGSHAHRGMTPRTQILFGPAGYFYVYFTYGMHWLMNVVTRERGYPAAILLRSAGDVRGPARLTRTLRVNGVLNGALAGRAAGLWFEDRGVVIPPSRIHTGPRVGIGYAGSYWKRRKWRFWIIPDSRYSSR